MDGYKVSAVDFTISGPERGFVDSIKWWKLGKSLIRADHAEGCGDRRGGRAGWISDQKCKWVIRRGWGGDEKGGKTGLHKQAREGPSPSAFSPTGSLTAMRSSLMGTWSTRRC